MNNINTKLVEDSVNGDVGAFGELYEVIYKDLYRFCYYYIPNKDEAADIVQEVAIDAFKGIEKLKDKTSFKSWILKIAAIKCKKHIKTIIIDKNQIDLEEIKDLTDNNISLSDELIDAVYLKKYIQNLSPVEKEILILAVIEEYTREEISKILKIPIGTVKSKLNRTLKKLKTSMEKELN